MKTWSVRIITIIAVLVAIGVAYSVFGGPGQDADTSITHTAEKQHLIDTVTISPADLAQATCEDGQECWIAVGGVVYDVSGTTWSNGRHHGIQAGTDATQGFESSPHGGATLENLPVIGSLGN